VTVLDPRQSFEAIARGPDAGIDLARAALLVAAEEYPGLDLDGYLDRLDALARQVQGRLAGRGDAERVALLNEFLFREQGFVGNTECYDDPRNSFLNDVLDRRRGIPITLSLVYTEVARRASLPAYGVGFPGHFLARVDGEAGVVVDAFHGCVLSPSDCARLLETLLGPGARLVPHLHLRPATPREILVRLVSNLKHLYLRRRDFGRALACCERILLLVPDAPLELRDRGLVYEQLECYSAAHADLRRFLELAPDDRTAPAVRERLLALGRRQPRLH
jgi:regulator of sirC expression with transglutaminase-like and TPR domain